MERTAYGQPTQPPQLHVIRDETPPPYDGHARSERRHFTMMSDEARCLARSYGMAALGLYTELEGRCNAQGRTYVTIETLARAFGCSKRHVQDALAKLRSLGLVQVEPTFGPTGLQLGNEFVLPFHPSAAKPQNPSNLRGEPRGEPTHEPRGEPSCAHVMEVSNTQVIGEVEGDKPPRATPKATRNRKTRMTEDYTLTEEEVATAHERYGMTRDQVEHELAKFRDYYIAKGEARASWPASWRNWLRNRDTYQRPAAPRPPTYQTKEDKRQHALDFFLQKAQEPS